MESIGDFLFINNRTSYVTTKQIKTFLTHDLPPVGLFISSPEPKAHKVSL